ncbi:MAG TPA: zinc ribbon domain-containing protein [Terriglobales bacterium]
MQVNNNTQTGFRGELRIIPTWAWVLAGIVFIAAQWFFNIQLAHHTDAPPQWCRPILALLAGFFGGCYFLLIGYISVDSRRRGMNAVLWSFMAALIPNALGFILYFLLRQPRNRVCPQCGTVSQPGFNFCSQCSCKLSPTCPQCQRFIGAGDFYCPHCGTSLRPQQPAQT